MAKKLLIALFILFIFADLFLGYQYWKTNISNNKKVIVISQIPNTGVEIEEQNITEKLNKLDFFAPARVQGVDSTKTIIKPAQVDKLTIIYVDKPQAVELQSIKNENGVPLQQVGYTTEFNSNLRRLYLYIYLQPESFFIKMGENETSIATSHVTLDVLWILTNQKQFLKDMKNSLVEKNKFVQQELSGNSSFLTFKKLK